MDMKKLIVEFREFQHERNRVKLIKRKMSIFTGVTFERGENRVWNVTIKVQPVQLNSAILFRSQNQPIFYLEDVDIVSYDNREQEATLVIFIYGGAETITLHFQNVQQKENFVLVLNEYLQFRNANSSPSDSGRSTLS